MRSVLQEDARFTIHGDDYATRDGTCVRDYVHVHDLGSAHLRAAEHLLAGGESGFFNLGTGNGTTVKELADAIEAVSGAPLRRVVGPRRPGDPPALVASNAKAKAILGWEPSRSSIAAILEDAWTWHKRVSAAANASAG